MEASITFSDILDSDEVWSDDLDISYLRDMWKDSSVECFHHFLDFMEATTDFERHEEIGGDTKPIISAVVAGEFDKPYRDALDGLDDELEYVVEKYLEVDRIAKKDRLLQKAIDILDDADRWQEEILADHRDHRNDDDDDDEFEVALQEGLKEALEKIKSEPISAGSWGSYKMRQANLLVENTEPPVLQKEDGNKNRYQVTDFGVFVTFVHWARQYYREKKLENPLFCNLVPETHLEKALEEVES